jgi:hypothetical protein
MRLGDENKLKAIFKRNKSLQKEIAEERGWVMRTSSRPSSRGTKVSRRKLQRKEAG